MEFVDSWKVAGYGEAAVGLGTLKLADSWKVAGWLPADTLEPGDLLYHKNNIFRVELPAYWWKVAEQVAEVVP